jgi:predicted enzyme related to lactoylglutathione lyase
MANQQPIEWPPAVTPYIVVDDARTAITWYVKVFGATLRGEPYIMDHAELSIDDGVLMLAESAESVPVRPPDRTAKHSHTVHLTVADVDSTADRAGAEGAEIEREPSDAPYGRVATIVDPFGHRWILNQPPADFTRYRLGDVGYITMGVRDTAKARAFYGELLGWEFEAGSHADGWQVTGVRPPMGIAGGSSEIQLCYRIADMEEALAKVRNLGGTAGEAEQKPYGRLATCTDDQGAQFHLWQPGD